MDFSEELLAKKISDLTVEELLLVLSKIPECIQNSPISAQKTDETQAGEESITITLDELIRATDPDYYAENHLIGERVYNLLAKFADEMPGMFVNPYQWVMVNLSTFATTYRSVRTSYGLRRPYGGWVHSWGKACTKYFDHMLEKRGFRV